MLGQIIECTTQGTPFVQEPPPSDAAAKGKGKPAAKSAAKDAKGKGGDKKKGGEAAPEPPSQAAGPPSWVDAVLLEARRLVRLVIICMLEGKKFRKPLCVRLRAAA